MSKSDNIDELVSSVRSFVAHKHSQRDAGRTVSERLVLTDDLKLSAEEAAAMDAEWQAELKALEDAGVIPAGRGQELTLEELEAAIAKLPEGWQMPASAEDYNAASANGFAEDEQDNATFDMAALEALIVSKIDKAIDQEALRALVVKTVREELSGELGERITRNVRKLVRREINRVITSRELGDD